MYIAAQSALSCQEMNANVEVSPSTALGKGLGPRRSVHPNTGNWSMRSQCKRVGITGAVVLVLAGLLSNILAVETAFSRD